MILDIDPLPFKLGFKAEESEGSVRINMTLYDTKKILLGAKNKDAILEVDYMDVRPALHSLKKVRKQANKLCRTLIGRKQHPFLWLEHKKVIKKRVNKAITCTILEEKLGNTKLLSRFHNNH